MGNTIEEETGRHVELHRLGGLRPTDWQNIVNNQRENMTTAVSTEEARQSEIANQSVGYVAYVPTQ